MMTITELMPIFIIIINLFIAAGIISGFVFLRNYLKSKKENRKLSRKAGGRSEEN